MGMEKQQEEMEETEKDIYLLGCQLQTVMEENARFQNGIQVLKEEEEELERESKSNERMISEYSLESASIRSWLKENWIDDFDLQADATCRDEAVVDQIGGLLGSTSDREAKVLFI